MTSPSIVATADKRVSFVELLFDLVFVFSVTQIVRLLHGEPSWVPVGQAVLIFWLVWLGWSQFTWALNRADTTHPRVELAVMVATALSFLMAVGVPDAFGAGALWFAVPYVLVRLNGLTILAWMAMAWPDPSVRRNVAVYALWSSVGFLAVLTGALAGGAVQYVLWSLTVLLDVISALLGGGRRGSTVYPEHFGERHGLFVIIALGETLIVAATGLARGHRTSELMLVELLAVGIAFGLWWSYFTLAKSALDHALESRQGQARSKLARDAYSLGHFPILCGILAYAAAVEAAVAHPDRPFHIAIRAALAACLVLFVGGIALVVWHASRRLLWPRLVVIALGAIAVVALQGIPPQGSLGLVFAAVVLVAVLERTGAADASSG
jgi:low temperature requirement protein LtrA